MVQCVALTFDLTSTMTSDSLCLPMKAYLELATLCDTNDSNKSDETLLQDLVSLSNNRGPKRILWIDGKVECVRNSPFSEAKRLGPQGREFSTTMEYNLFFIDTQCYWLAIHLKSMAKFKFAIIYF